MSPQQAHRLVGHTDFTERLRDQAIDCVTAANEIDLLRSENEDLRAVLRAVRASTDPEFSARLISHALREAKP
jgi:hypothetical protein